MINMVVQHAKSNIELQNIGNGSIIQVRSQRQNQHSKLELGVEEYHYKPSNEDLKRDQEEIQRKISSRYNVVSDGVCS